MNLKRTARALVVSIAALGITATSMTAANADKPTTAEASISSAASASVPGAVSSQGVKAAAGEAMVTNLRVANHVLSYSGSSYIPAQLAIANVPGSYVRSALTQVRVNGVYKGTIDIAYRSTGIPYQSSWGAGKVQLGPTTITGRTGSPGYYDFTVVDQTRSNFFQVRNGIRGSLYIHKRGSKMKFDSTLTVFKGKKFKPAKKKKVIVQVKKGKKWKKLKKVKLNKKGKKSFTIHHKGKRKYRMVFKQTAKIQGGKTRVIKI